jgi:hypothetical protein
LRYKYHLATPLCDPFNFLDTTQTSDTQHGEQESVLRFHVSGYFSLGNKKARRSGPVTICDQLNLVVKLNLVALL